MRKLARWMTLFAVAFSFYGCGIMPQTVVLTPSVEITRSDIGNGRQVVLRVIDERPSKSLGHRADTFGPGGEITTNQDVPSILEAEISRTLADNGFDVLRNVKTTPTLTLELRHFEYTMSQGLTFGLHVRGAVKAIAITSADRYERLYRVAVEERTLFATGEGNEAVLNRGLTELIAEITKDRDLLKFLATSH